MQRLMTTELMNNLRLVMHNNIGLIIAILGLAVMFSCANPQGQSLTKRSGDSTVSQNSAAIIEVVRNGELGKMKELLEKGADPNGTDSLGYTPLMIATLRGNDEAIRALIKAQANVNALNTAGASALTLAIESRHSSAALILIENGADLHRTYKHGWTALHYAVDVADSETVAALLQKRIQVDSKDEQGRTALHIAAHTNPEIVRSLIRAGADVNARDVRGWTPLMEAAGANSAQLVSILIDDGADVTAKDNDGWTALRQALLYSCDDVVEKIEQRGAVE